MGTLNNECVIVTTSDVNAINNITNWINTVNEYYRKLFVIVPGLTNGHVNFILSPDGSKKGWDLSNAVEEIRRNFIAHVQLLNEKYSVRWVEVGFGEYGQKLLQGNNYNSYNDAEYAVITLDDGSAPSNFYDKTHPLQERYTYLQFGCLCTLREQCSRCEVQSRDDLTDVIDKAAATNYQLYDLVWNNKANRHLPVPRSAK
jgi:hypothetical protein